jgi:hypothetical protein
MRRLREAQQASRDSGDSDDEQDHSWDRSHGLTLLIVGSKNARKWTVVHETT